MIVFPRFWLLNLSVINLRIRRLPRVDFYLSLVDCYWFLTLVLPWKHLIAVGLIQNAWRILKPHLLLAAWSQAFDRRTSATLTLWLRLLVGWEVTLVVAIVGLASKCAEKDKVTGSWLLQPLLHLLLSNHRLRNMFNQVHWFRTRTEPKRKGLNSRLNAILMHMPLAYIRARLVAILSASFSLDHLHKMNLMLDFTQTTLKSDTESWFVCLAHSSRLFESLVWMCGLV